MALPVPLAGGPWPAERADRVGHARSLRLRRPAALRAVAGPLAPVPARIPRTMVNAAAAAAPPEVTRRTL
eukprot:scaffold32534_cov49-Phaeocystis_antarctica.AAC.3